MEKALAEDPSVYEYDNVYDDMKEKKEKETTAGKNASKPNAVSLFSGVSLIC